MSTAEKINLNDKQIRRMYTLFENMGYSSLAQVYKMAEQKTKMFGDNAFLAFFNMTLTEQRLEASHKQAAYEREHPGIIDEMLANQWR